MQLARVRVVTRLKAKSVFARPLPGLAIRGVWWFEVHRSVRLSRVGEIVMFVGLASLFIAGLGIASDIWFQVDRHRRGLNLYF